MTEALIEDVSTHLEDKETVVYNTMLPGGPALDTKGGICFHLLPLSLPPLVSAQENRNKLSIKIKIIKTEFSYIIYKNKYLF